MKTYRKALADAHAFQVALEYLVDCADSFMEDADNARERMKEADSSEKGLYVDIIVENEGKAAAFERLIEKLSK